MMMLDLPYLPAWPFSIGQSAGKQESKEIGKINIDRDRIVIVRCLSSAALSSVVRRVVCWARVDRC